MILSDIKETLQAREETYAFLAAAYRERPSAGFLGGLLTGLAGDHTVVDGCIDLDADAAGDGGESEGFALLRAWAARARARDLPTLETELAGDYARLFYASDSQAYVKPYESVYTSPDHMLMQAAHGEVLAAYYEEGLARVSGFVEPEDHLAAELEFMAYLNSRAHAALEEGDLPVCLAYLEKQRRFVERHLLAWVPQFLEDLGRAAPGGFYAAVAAITGEVVSSEQAELPALIAACSGT